MSESFEPDTVSTAGLTRFMKALKGQPPVARVGILAGGKNNRTPEEGQKSAPNNATIGAAHEFGSIGSGMPARSFLRVPISENLDKRLEASKLLTDEELKQVLKDGSLAPWLKQVAVEAEGIVLDAFESNGFGKWAPWKDPNYENNTGQILVDTQQLRDSITHDVKEGK